MSALQAAALLQARVSRVERHGGRGSREASNSEMSRGAFQAMLRVTLEDLDEAAEQARRGDVFTLEEVRRELLARNRS